MSISVTLSDAPLPLFTLGTAQLGLPYGIANRTGQPDESRSFAILRAALAHGVEVLDTAARYGDSEQVIGRFLAVERPSPAPRIVTKVIGGLTDADTVQSATALLRRQVEASLERLGLDRLPYGLLHQPDDLIHHGAVLADSFRRLVSDGLIERAGVSVYRPEEAEALLQHDVFQVIQIPINLFDQRWRRSGVLARLADRRVTVFARSVYLQGLFFINPDELVERIPQAVAPLRQLRELSDAAGMHPGHLAMAYVRDLPGIDSLVIGCETVQQVADNAALLRQAPPLAAAIREKAETLFADLPDSLLNPGQWGIAYKFSDTRQR